jgi:hypothetical protein
MPPFDALREQLLRAGIAPRHVRRYVGELCDHFDDLVGEETASGASRKAAASRARQRLGSDSDLAAFMLDRPDQRSLAARYPLIVFGLGPLAMVLAAVVVGLVAEFGVIKLAHALVPHPSAVQRESFVSAIGIWNSLASYVVPLAIAVALCVVGLRQRMPPAWIFAGVACACVFGAFQETSFFDNGHHGELSIAYGLLPPFSTRLIVGGVYRIAVTVASAGAICWFGVRRRGPGAAEGDEAVTAF